jgi:cytochrome c peroxidase
MARIPGILLVLAIAAAAALPAAAADAPPPDAAERERIVSLGPWPPAVARDPSNRVSGKPGAIALGERLFSSPRLSGEAGIRCATCHEQWRSFMDGRAKGEGVARGRRNTMTLLNVSLNRWFGWDGANDSLWAQSIRPMLDPREMKSGAAQVAGLMRSDPELVDAYAKAFGTALPAEDEAVLVDVAKALAAYQETLFSGRTAFDDFRDALARGDARAAARYPAAAQRGVRLFVGKGQCVSCHAGPNFSDNAFRRSLIGAASADAEPDTGRQGGLAAVLASRFNLLGRYNDDATRASAGHTRQAAAEPNANREGFFRTPSLREVAATGPYMHDGSVASLCDAAREHAQGQPALSLDERRDVLAFLRTLGVDPDPPFVDQALLRCR